MKMPNSLRGYWLLIEILLFPFAWLKWLLLVGAALLPLGLVILLMAGSPILLIVAGSVLFGISILLNLFTLPGFFLTVNSSKQLSQLPDLRRKSMVIFFGYTLITAALIALFIAKMGNVAFITTFVSVSLIVTIFNFWSLIITYCWPSLLAFCAAAMFLLAKSFHILTEINIIYSSSSLIICWVLFVRWSLTWRPNHYHRFKFSFSQQEMNEILKNNYNTLLNRPITTNLNSKPHTLIGTLLLGAPDGWQASLTRTIFLLSLLVLGFYIFPVFFKNTSNSSLVNGLYILFVTALIGQSMQFAQSIVNNLHKLWLHFGESRLLFLGRLEKLFYSRAITTNVVFITSYALTRMVFPNDDKHLLMVLILTLGALNMGVCLYAGLVIYCRTAAHAGLLATLQIFLLMLYIAIVTFWNVALDEHEAFVLRLTIPFFIALLISIFILRARAKRLWQRVDFVRRSK